MNKNTIKDMKSICKIYNLEYLNSEGFSFIRKFKTSVNWDYISEYQKLSEPFIKEFKDSVNWYYISSSQKLSEPFIKEFKDSVNWDYISRYQKLSEPFIKEFDIEIPTTNWLYKTKEEKLEYLKRINIYKIINNEYLIAYKSIRSDSYSVFNFQYLYEVGKTYEAHCDYNINNDYSFGLSAWTKEKALNYYSDGKLLKVRINIEDLGAVVHDGNKLRCSKLTVLEEV